MADRAWRRELTKPRPAATAPVAPFAPAGKVDPDMLGDGATGAGDRYLADDGTWKPISGLGGGGGGGGNSYFPSGW